MEEIHTFSALIDEVVVRSGRKDRLNSIVGYARTAIRECMVLDFFDQSLVELTVTVGTVPFLWERPSDLRNVLSIRYPYFTRRNKPVFAKEKKPGYDVANLDYFFYLSGNTFAMAGLAVGDLVDVAYYSYAPPLRHYATVTDRPARYNLETESWEYNQAYTASDELKETARDLVTNWLLTYWYEVVIEGTLTKLFKLVNDDIRMRTAYALYKSGQKDLVAGESAIYIGKR